MVSSFECFINRTETSSYYLPLYLNNFKNLEIASSFDESKCLTVKNKEKVDLDNSNNEIKANFELKSKAVLQTIQSNSLSNNSKMEGEK